LAKVAGGLCWERCPEVPLDTALFAGVTKLNTTKQRRRKEKAEKIKANMAQEADARREARMKVLEKRKDADAMAEVCRRLATLHSPNQLSAREIRGVFSHWPDLPAGLYWR
jgi:hypothetical protein